jgi:hypothetical protein
MKKVMPYLCAVTYALLLSLSATMWMYCASVMLGSVFSEISLVGYFYTFAAVSVACVVGIIAVVFANIKCNPSKLVVKLEAVITAGLFIPSLWMWDTLLHLWFA